MAWRIDGPAGVTVHAGGGSTTFVTEVNENGDRRTTTVERDAAGNEVRREVDRRNGDGSRTRTLDETLPGGTKVHETQTSDAQGNATTDRTETDPRGHTKRVKTSITIERGKIVQKREEFTDGVRRYRRITTSYPRTRDEFIDEMWWDEKKRAYRKRHRHNRNGMEQYDFDHPLPIAMWTPFGQHDAGLVLVAQAGAGAVIGGFADPELYGETHRVHLRSGENCASVKPDADGRFQLPPGVTKEGEAIVEIVDRKGEVAVSRNVAIGPASKGAPEIVMLERHSADERMLVVRGAGLAAVPQTAEQLEGWAGSLVLFEGEMFTDVAAPIAWSDREVFVRAPMAKCMLAVHDGMAGTSATVECGLTARWPC